MTAIVVVAAAHDAMFAARVGSNMRSFVFPPLPPVRTPCEAKLLDDMGVVVLWAEDTHAFLDPYEYSMEVRVEGKPSFVFVPGGGSPPYHLFVGEYRGSPYALVAPQGVCFYVNLNQMELVDRGFVVGRYVGHFQSGGNSWTFVPSSAKAPLHVALEYVEDVAIGPDGNLYVADSGYKLVVKYTSEG